MSAVAHLPFYSTSYGESFGYNEREGSNANAFRNRYLNQGFRGSADLGPVRFNATRAQASQSLNNLARPQSAQFGMRSQPLVQTQQQLSATVMRPQSAAPYRGLERSWEAELSRSGRPAALEQQQQPQSLAQSQRLSEYASQAQQAYGEQPRGVYTQSAQQQQQQQQQANAFYANQANVNSRPYYYAPHDAPPNQSYAPPARALGNKTYEFDTADSNYAYRDSFAGEPLRSSKPRQDPGQSIPFGRLAAEDAKDVRMRMSLSSWDTFNVADRSASAQSQFNLSGLNRGVQKERAGDFCKDSISKRLPVGAQLRYHLPGYMGWVKNEQFRHGATYGKTTRLCLADSKLGL